MPATSRWNTKQEQEGLRIADDINAGNEALESFMLPIEAERERLARNKKRRWNPEIHVTLGNHEFHIMRYVEEHPELAGIISYDMLDFEKWGIIVHDFKVPMVIDGIWYCHYFYSPNTGRPLSGMMETRLKNIGHSFTQGHTQGFKCGQLERPNGRTDHGLVAGSFYQHNEDYRGPQATNEWRGVVMKHEVKDGEYNIMQVSLQFLLRRYSG